MKSKTLVGLFLICGILAGITYLMFSEKSETTTQGKMGEILFETLPVNEVTAITIKSPDSSVVLKKGENVWIVENRFGYSANFSMITDLVKKLKDIKIGRQFKASDDTISRLALHDPERKETTPDQKGIRLILEGKEKKVFADIILGKEKESSGGEGNYFMRTGESVIYIADKSFKQLNKKPAEWIEKEVLKVKAEDVEKIVCIKAGSQKSIYTLKRPEKGKDAELGDIPAGKKTAKHKINSVIGAISSLQIDDVADPSVEAILSGFNNLTYLEYYLFDGTVYKVYPGKAVETDPEKYYCKISAAYIPPEIKPEPEPPPAQPVVQPVPVIEGKPDEKADPGKVEPKPEDLLKEKQEKEKQEAENRQKLAKDAEELNKKISTWVYVIAKSKYNNLILNPEEFFEQEAPKGQEPRTPLMK